jgi:hypothetical protein
MSSRGRRSQERRPASAARSDRRRAAAGFELVLEANRGLAEKALAGRPVTREPFDLSAR